MLRWFRICPSTVVDGQLKGRRWVIFAYAEFESLLGEDFTSSTWKGSILTILKAPEKRKRPRCDVDIWNLRATRNLGIYVHVEEQEKYCAKGVDVVI